MIHEPMALFWPAVSIATALVLTITIWMALERRHPAVTERTGSAGGLVLFGQSADAITTMVGIDVLGFSEQVRLSRLIIDATATLPGVQILGTTWLFVLLKLGVAIGFVIWIGRSTELSPFGRRATLGIAAATGLIPAANNLALQAVS